MFRFPKNEQNEQILEKFILWIGQPLGLGLTRLLLFDQVKPGVRSSQGFWKPLPVSLLLFSRGWPFTHTRQRGRLLGSPPPNVHRVHSAPGLKRTDAILSISFTSENFGLKSIVPH